jgi:hypothetical protein
MLGEAPFDSLHSDAKARFKEAGMTRAEQDVMHESAVADLAGLARGPALYSEQALLAFLDAEPMRRQRTAFH